MDLINGCFELIGGILLFGNCWRMHKDKQLKGVSWLPTLFFTSWGFWNLLYYPALNQWFSFAGGCVIVLANTPWLGMTLYYLRQPSTHIVACPEEKQYCREPAQL
jgi:hypothetical protein